MRGAPAPATGHPPKHPLFCLLLLLISCVEGAFLLLINEVLGTESISGHLWYELQTCLPITKKNTTAVRPKKPRNSEEPDLEHTIISFPIPLPYNLAEPVLHKIVALLYEQNPFKVFRKIIARASQDYCLALRAEFI